MNKGLYMYNFQLFTIRHVIFIHISIYFLITLVSAGQFQAKVSLPDGTPCKGAITILKFNHPSYPYYFITNTVIADSNGIATFDKLQKGVWEVKIFDPQRPFSLVHWENHELRFEIIKDESVNVKCTLKKKSSLLKINLVGGSKKRKDRGALWINSMSWYEEFDSSTIFCPDIPSGKFTFECRVLPFGISHGDIIIQPDTINEIDIEVNNTPPVNCQFVDENGGSVGEIFYRVKNYGVSFSQKNGSFLLPSQLKGSRWKIEILHNNFSDTIVGLPANLPNNNFTIKLIRADGWIRGQISTYSKDSLSETKVSVYKFSNSPEHTLYNHRRICTPARDGRFEIKGIDTTPYLINIASEGYNSYADTILPPIDLGTITLYKKVDLDLTLIDDITNKPVDSAHVGNWFRVNRDSKGKNYFNFGGQITLPSFYDGMNYFYINAPGYLFVFDSFYVERGIKPKPRTIRLKKGTDCTIAVNALGQTLKGAKIRITSPQFWWWNDIQITDSAGKAILKNYPKINFTLAVSCQNYVPKKVSIDLNYDNSFVVDLQPGEKISGIVLDNKNNPVTNLRIIPEPFDKQAFDLLQIKPQDAQLKNGKFELTELPSGIYTLVIALPWDSKYTWAPLYRFDSIPTNSNNLTLRLPQRRDWIIRPTYKGKLITDKDYRIALIMPTVNDTFGTNRSLNVGSEFFSSTAKGEYTIPAYEGSKYVVYVEGDGFAPQFKAVSIEPGNSPLVTNIELSKSLWFTGKITSYDSTIDLSFLRIEAIKNFKETEPIRPLPLSTRSDKKGNFHYPIVPIGQFHLCIFNDSWDLLYYGLHHGNSISRSTPITLQKPGYIKLQTKSLRHLTESQRLLKMFIKQSPEFEVNTINLNENMNEVISFTPGIYNFKTLNKVLNFDVAVKSCETTYVSITSNTPKTRVSLINYKPFTGYIGTVALYNNDTLISTDQFPDMDEKYICKEKYLEPGKYRFVAQYTNLSPSTVYVIDTCLIVTTSKSTNILKAKCNPLSSELRINLTAKDKPLSGSIVFIRNVNSIRKDETQFYWNNELLSDAYLIKQTTDESGNLNIAGLHPGKYRITIAHPFYVSKDTVVTVDSGLTNNIRILTEPGIPLKLFVTAQNHALIDYTVSIFDSMQTLCGSIRHDQWRYYGAAISYAVKPGNYTVLITHSKMASEQIKISTKTNSYSIPLESGAWFEISKANLDISKIKCIGNKGVQYSIIGKPLNTFYDKQERSQSVLFGPVHEGNYSIYEGDTLRIKQFKIRSGEISKISW